ncbi:MAG: dual specificity protein phosphatase family protein [Candidatus Obscuribacterales bacterium]|jgi:protein tyrosine/serine phosphatase|nr:dual specificity protein phosphatase family protein [Candidatus Obscuribacterales bacterium]
MNQLDKNLLQEMEDLLVNFQVVSPVVLRGGQPDEEGLELLKRGGVKLVVNLRHHAKSSPKPASSYSFFRRGDDDEIEEEQEIAERLGLRFLNISLDGVTAPTFADIDKFVQLFSDPENQPMYVHCLHGRERTGFMLAAYRMKIESWTVEQAYQEMLQQGFDPLRTVLSDVLFEYAKR